MTILSDDMVEKAARAKWGDPHEFPWDEMSDPCKNIWRAEVRRALQAVLPDVIERCAKVADEHARRADQELHGHDRMYEARRIATAIRSLSQDK